MALNQMLSQLPVSYTDYSLFVLLTAFPSRLNPTFLDALRFSGKGPQLRISLTVGSTVYYKIWLLKVFRIPV